MKREIRGNGVGFPSESGPVPSRNEAGFSASENRATPSPRPRAAGEAGSLLHRAAHIQRDKLREMLAALRLVSREG